MSSGASSPFDPATVMMRLSSSAHDVLTAEDLWRGVCVMGATGSGKSTSSGRMLMGEALKRGWGMLVTTVKASDTQDAVKLAQACGRGNDVILFGPEHPQWSFNPLSYECSRPGDGGGLVENIARLILTTIQAQESGGAGGGASGGDPFWQRAAMMMLRNAIALCVDAGEPVSFGNLSRIIQSGPQSMDQLEDPVWRATSYCLSLIVKAKERQASGGCDGRDLDLVAAFWLSEYPNQAPQTRSSIALTVSTMTDAFARGQMRDLFASGTTLLPEFLYHGKIIILDMPVKTYGDLGRMGQVIFKLNAFAALERRDVKKFPRPVMVVQDEFQELVTKDDTRFQATARSARVCNLCLTQSLSGLYAKLGGQSEGQACVDALLTNLAVKVLHANSDPTTNHWVEQMLGKRWVYQSSSSISSGQKDPSSPWKPITPQASSTSQKAQISNVESAMFLSMRGGGAANQYLVDALVHMTGRVWAATGRTDLQVVFKQQF